MKALTFVEVDIEVCSLTYGVAPCTGAIGTTGDRKCFNSKATCQDRANFAASTVTLRFAEGTAYLTESGIDAIGCIESISYTPGTISLGEDIGTRSSLKVSFSDFPWPDTGPGYDPYLASRPYDPFATGTYWGKFRARQPYLRGRPVRLIRGFLGQSLNEMEVRHFIGESIEAAGLDGRATLIAKDGLKSVDDDRALAPKPSSGFLVSALAADATTATLAPAGIGAAEYPAAGVIAIGGKEICAFTRVGDALTLTRAQYGTVATDHEAQDRVQLCLVYAGSDPADIIADLFVNYAQVPSDMVPVTEWQGETSAFLRRVYSAVIAEPTGVNKLVSELNQQAALAVWFDDVDRKVRLQVLRPILTDAEVYHDEGNLAGTLKVSGQPAKRASQVWVYFGQANPLKKVDDTENYRSAALVIDLQAEENYGEPAVKKIFARWIPPFGRLGALRLGNLVLGRFRDAPRKFSLSRFRDGGQPPLLGRGYKVGSRILQKDTGEPDLVPVQVVRVNPGPATLDVEAEEMRFVILDDEDLDNRTLIVDADSFNIDFRAAHDLLYPAPASGDEVTIIIEAGVIVGSTSTAAPAFDVGDWPSGVTLKMILRGRIQGRGGDGGTDGSGPGKAGGLALYTRVALTVTSEGGAVYGGGGGGGAWRPSASTPTQFVGGGGGQGSAPGLGGVGTYGNGEAGTTEAGGLGGLRGSRRAGSGGGAGEAGDAYSYSGGSAGGAIDGVSYVTLVGSTDIRGTQIN